MTLNKFWNLARGQADDKPKTDPLRYCIILPDASAHSDEKGPLIYTDAEVLKEACQTAGGIPSTFEAAEQIVKQANELDELHAQVASFQIQLDRAVQHSNFIGNKSAQTVKEHEDAAKRIEWLESAMKFAIEQLHHSYNDAPDWLEKDTHGWIRRAAIELRDALNR
ncbi:MAG TPA: hypothetical protein VF478_09815 [Anaerolineae bacterium]